MSPTMSTDIKHKPWWVYVIKSQTKGWFYVGSTTDPKRRLKEHNGLKKGGGRYTAKHRPWAPAALFGPYKNRSEAFKAEMTLKKKRGLKRLAWSPQDSPLCRGLGPKDPWVQES